MLMALCEFDVAQTAAAAAEQVEEAAEARRSR